MKYVIITLLCLLTFMTTKAQEPQAYRPMLVEERSWLTQIDNPVYRNEFTYTLHGDSLIDGTKWHKLYRETVLLNYDREGHYVEIQRWEPVLECCLLEQDRQVYAFQNGRKSLMYDFNLMDGDDAFTTTYTCQKLSGIDTVCVNGNMFCRYRLTETCREAEHLQYTGFWVEGIGSNYGLTQSYGWDVIPIPHLVAVFDGDECVFTADDFYAPAWTGEQTAVQSYHVDHPASSPLFDLQGRRIPSGKALPSRHGVFIRDGKKILR